MFANEWNNLVSVIIECIHLNKQENKKYFSQNVQTQMHNYPLFEKLKIKLLLDLKIR